MAAAPSLLQPCHLIQGGLIPYGQAWHWQTQQMADRQRDPDLADTLLLLEHPPVYTLGRGSSLDFIKFTPPASFTAGVTPSSRAEPTPPQPGPELHRTERGGEVTYHCPGQLVGYPILNLRRHQPDLHWYLRQLEEVLIRVLDHYGLRGERIPGLTGVWLEGRKVAALGIKVSRWITMHGFALNICPDLQGFGSIVPCGIGDRPVGSLAQFLPHLTVADVRQQVALEFARCFGLHYVTESRNL